MGGCDRCLLSLVFFFSFCFVGLLFVLPDECCCRRGCLFYFADTVSAGIVAMPKPWRRALAPWWWCDRTHSIPPMADRRKNNNEHRSRGSVRLVNTGQREIPTCANSRLAVQIMDACLPGVAMLYSVLPLGVGFVNHEKRKKKHYNCRRERNDTPRGTRPIDDRRNSLVF